MRCNHSTFRFLWVCTFAEIAMNLCEPSKRMEVYEELKILRSEMMNDLYTASLSLPICIEEEEPR